MKRTWNLALLALAFLWIALAGCTNSTKEKQGKESSTLEASGEDHPRKAHGEGEGEESGTEMGLDEVFDEVRKGTHLVLSFDIEASEFVGTVENVSDQILDRVRIEVHLSNGTELGPTTQVDLKPGESREINLNAGNNSFQTWSTIAEVGSGEHSHEGEHDHSHESEHSHEH